MKSLTIVVGELSSLTMSLEPRASGDVTPSTSLPSLENGMTTGHSTVDIFDASQDNILGRRLEAMMRDIMDSYLYTVRYQPDRCSKLAKDICEVIKVNTVIH